VQGSIYPDAVMENTETAAWPILLGGCCLMTQHSNPERMMVYLNPLCEATMSVPFLSLIRNPKQPVPSLFPIPLNGTDSARRPRGGEPRA